MGSEGEFGYLAHTDMFMQKNVAKREHQIGKFL